MKQFIKVTAIDATPKESWRNKYEKLRKSYSESLKETGEQLPPPTLALTDDDMDFVKITRYIRPEDVESIERETGRNTVIHFYKGIESISVVQSPEKIISEIEKIG